MAKSIAEYVAEGVETPQTQQGLDIMAERARGEEEGAKPEGRASLDIKSAPVKMPTRPGQESVVTPAMIKAAGFDNLRDYMNAKKGLVRRGEKPAEKSYQAATKFDPAGFSARGVADSMRATQYKQNGYAKGGKISLDACGVSTHKPAKKNANW